MGYPVWKKLECFFVDIELEFPIFRVVFDSNRYLELLVEEVDRKSFWVVHIGNVPRLIKLVEDALEHAGARVVRDHAVLIFFVQAHIKDGLIDDAFLLVLDISTVDLLFVVVTLAGLFQIVVVFAVDFQRENHLGDLETYIDIPDSLLTARIVDCPCGELLESFPASEYSLRKAYVKLILTCSRRACHS